MKSAFALLFLANHTLTASTLEPYDLRCEYHADPIAMGAPEPRFSWKIRSTDPTARGVVQSAYEIEVVSENISTKGKPLWSSGIVESNQTDQIVWKGSPLVSRDRAAWKVRVWQGKDNPSAWSKPASFGVGLLAPEDWQALWISAPEDESFTTRENIQNFVTDPKRGVLTVTPAKYLRKDFTTKTISRATLHATAMGVFTLEINGQRVSDKRLAPGWSAYQRRIHSKTYDVSNMIQVGDNTIGATLADGWYSGYVAYGLLTGQEGLVPGQDGRY